MLGVNTYMLRPLAAAVLCACPLLAQMPDNRSLNGRYFVRHLQLTADDAGKVSSARSFSGSFAFNGSGGFTFSGQQNAGAGAATNLNGSGVYTVEPSGFVTLTNPQQTGATIQARMGSGVLTGSSTEAAVFDFFVALAAPASGAGNNWLNGTYWIASLDFQSGSAPLVRNAFFKAAANGAGSFGNVAVSGQAASIPGGQNIAQTIDGVTYSVTSDGSGTLTFPGASTTQLVAGAKVLYVSRDGAHFIAGSSSGQDVIVGMKSFGGTANAASFRGLYFTTGLRFDGGFNASAGASNALGQGKLVHSRRVRTAAATVYLTAVNQYTVAGDGSGAGPEMNSFALGAGGDAFLGSGVGAAATGIYEIYFGVRAPAVSGAGVFLHPHGVTSPASYAPVGSPLSPGAFFTLYGSGFLNRTETAQRLPFPRSLGGVEVLINNTRAPLYVVAPNQIIGLTPYGVTGSKATIAVNSNGTVSNTVTAPLGATSPAIFTLSRDGLGAGAILKADYSLVGPANRARAGETVLVFLAGLGAVTPSVADGAAAPASPLARVNSTIHVYVGGVPAQMTFQGLAPGLAGLYQLNVLIPRNAPAGDAVALAVETPDGFHDMADIAIGP